VHPAVSPIEPSNTTEETLEIITGAPRCAYRPPGQGRSTRAR
jgi:hypothetical protein